MSNLNKNTKIISGKGKDVDNFMFLGSTNNGKPSQTRKKMKFWLCRFWYMQIHSTATVLDFVVELVNVVSQA